jgi:GNAT superfamily N-acetyltransferase
MAIEYLSSASHEAGQYLRLMKNSFSKTFDESWFYWYNTKSPTGPSRLYSYIDTDSGEIVSSVCFLPLRMARAGTVVPGSIYVNAMTHPAYQGRGFNLKLLNLALDEAREGGDIFSITFPATDRASMGGMLRTGWEPVCEIHYAALGRALTQTRPKAREVGRLDGRFDDLLAKFHAGIGFGVSKDHSFLNWRICDRPDQAYSIHAHFHGGAPAGFIVLKQYEEPGVVKTHIMDLVALDREVTIDLLEVAEHQAFERESNILNVWKWDDSIYSDVLKSYGFVDTAAKNTLLVHRHGGSASSLTAGARMHISLADNDVY